MLLGGFLIRYLRWLAFLQQKEYRLDRIWLFLHSREGKRELVRIIPRKADFSRTGCKRPKFTKRMMLVVALLIPLCMLIFWQLFLFFVSFFFFAPVSFISACVVLYLGAPAIILIASAPTAFISRLLVHRTARQAQKLLAKHDPIIIGITGSYGKSSTKALLHHMLSAQHTVFATPKSFNTLYSIANSVVTGYTGQKIAIVEYGAYVSGEITRITHYIRPFMAIITGFAPQHLGLFGSMENIQKAKAELVAALPKDGTVYSNASDAGTAEIVARGLKKSAAQHVPIDWHLLFTDVQTSDRGKLSFKHKGKKIETQLIGKQYIENIALAWSVASQFVTEKDLCIALESFQPSNSFMCSYQHASGRLIIDDGGTSNPRGFEVALTLLESLPGAEKVVITPGIVDLGSKSDQVHRQLAEKMGRVADTVWYVGDSGAEVSAQVLGKKMLTDKEEILSLLHTKSQNGIVLVEGRMPAWLLEPLKEAEK